MNIGNTLKTGFVETNDVFDAVLKANKKYSAHPRILSIKERMNNDVLSFRNVTHEEVLNEINNLGTLKASHSKDIPFVIIKGNTDVITIFILQNLHQCIINGKFPDQLKKQRLSTVFEKGNHNDKTNYWPVSILSSLENLWASDWKGQKSPR